MSEHFDVIVVGAGLSGIGAGYHLQTRCPSRTYAILEGRERMGGTWDLFRYPGIRSDSDMFTLGFSFRPWKDQKAIADGPSILRYIQETAAEYGIDRKIRYGHKVTRANWSSEDARWTVETRGEGGAVTRFTCSFLFMCGGYYDYDEGYTPEFPGREQFGGRVVHPQFWTDDIDCAGKRVVVIGSGATAITLVPALADAGAQVTMLQRSPTYVVSLPAVDKVSTWARRLLPARLAYQLVRWKNVARSSFYYAVLRRYPEKGRAEIRKGVRMALGRDYDVDTHFQPKYDPWDQRLCVAPDGDFFKAIRRGDAEVVTDHIETFTERGLRLRSGRELEADVVVTATGLKLNFAGGMRCAVDGVDVNAPERMTYKSMMVSDVPNFAIAFGYTNASWTLKVDLTAEYVCRVLNHMERGGHSVCVARRDPSVPERPFVDFSSGYVQRARHLLPKQGARTPWRVKQNYLLDLLMLRLGRLRDGVLEFS